MTSITSTPRTAPAPEPTGRTGRSPWRRWLLRGAAAVAALLVIAIGLMAWHMSYVPAGLDYATTRLTDGGAFRISYVPQHDPIPINQIHTWTLTVERADGTPVEDAHVHVDGDMPQHGHGLPTVPEVGAHDGGGRYVVEGVKFQMGGWWVMDVTVESGGVTDTVRFNMMLGR